MVSKAHREASPWLKTGLLLLPLAMGITLVGGAFSNRQRTHEASELLIQAQAHAFIRTVATNLRHAPPRERSELLHELLAEFEDDGLKFLALASKNGSIEASAGAGQLEQPNTRDDPKRSSLSQITRHGELVHVDARLAPRRPGRNVRHRFAARRDARPSLGLLHIEFEPTVAVRLQQDADRAFLLSSISALVLMLLAAALWWQLRRREAVAAATERERRLAQLGEMSAVLAHEMRNPLASLKGHAQLLLEQLSAGTREAKKAERVVSEAGRLETLSRTLLDFIRSGTIERRRVDATALIQEAVDEFEADQIRLDVHGKVERKVSLDPLRIHQVIVNLLQNALEATSDPEPVEVSLEIGSGTFKVTVRDRGPGLPADADKIFEAFHTDKVQGTGLGLAIARRIVELHDGTLTAENHPDGGALFVLEARG